MARHLKEPRTRSGAPHSTALLGGIADRLARFSEDAEAFGIVLCSDGDVATRYLLQLQQIDALAQSLREMANVLSASDPEAAVAAIRLGELRHTLEKGGGVLSVLQRHLRR